MIATLTAAQCESLKSSILPYARTLAWGSFGPEGKDPCVVRELDDLDTDHLENILITQRHIPLEYSAAILLILKERYERARQRAMES